MMRLATNDVVAVDGGIRRRFILGVVGQPLLNIGFRQPLS